MSENQSTNSEAEHPEDEVLQAFPEEQTNDSSPAEDELAEANNRVLYAQAELENYRKRVRRDMEEERRYAALPLIRDLLSVQDNLHRAMEAAGQGDTQGGLLEGVKMVVAQLDGVLQQHHCKRIGTVGEVFDPNQHEAIGQEPSEEHPANTVSRETQTGYVLHDRVVRPALVFVSLGKPAGTENGAG